MYTDGNYCLRDSSFLKRTGTMAKETPQPPLHRRHEPFPRLTMPLGHEIILAVNYVGAESLQQIKGRFVGAEDYSFVVGLFPTLMLSITSFCPKTPVNISFKYEGSMYRFFSEVICHNSTPAPLLFFNYPDRITITDMRQSERVSCSIPCSIFSQSGEANAVIADISEQGCRAIIPLVGNSNMRQLKVGDDLVLNCSFAINQTLIIPGVVKSIVPKGPFLAFGIQFSEVNTFTSEAKNFIRLLTSINNITENS